MNKTKTIFLLVLLFSSLTIDAQKDKATLFFKDGNTLHGYAKLKENGKVKFRKTNDSKAMTYHFGNLERVEFFLNDEKVTYVRLEVKGKSKAITLKQLVQGEISLFSAIDHNVGAGYLIEEYYLKKQDEKKPILLTTSNIFSKNFKKVATEYFKDCSKLIQKINNKEFKKRDIEEIVTYYNSECNQ